MDAALGEGEVDGGPVRAGDVRHAVAVDVPVVGKTREIAGGNSGERAREGDEAGVRHGREGAEEVAFELELLVADVGDARDETRIAEEVRVAAVFRRSGNCSGVHKIHDGDEVGLVGERPARFRDIHRPGGEAFRRRRRAADEACRRAAPVGGGVALEVSRDDAVLKDARAVGVGACAGGV